MKKQLHFTSMNLIKLYIFLLLLVSVLSEKGFSTTDAICNTFYEKNFIREMNRLTDDQVFHYDTKIFYSKKLNTCLIAASKKSGVYFFIQDMTLDFLVDRMTSRVFECDQSGVTAIILPVVIKRKGDVSNLSYKLWLDNDQGGSPAMYKPSDTPYTRKMCDAHYKKWLQNVK